MNPSGPRLAVGFTGDISFTGRFAEAALRTQDAAMVFGADIIRFLAQNRWNVGNIEGPLTRARPDKRSGVALQSPPESAPLLRQLNVNCYNLANNHAMDCGLPGLEDTFACARQHGAMCFGAGRDLAQASQPLILEQAGVRVGLLAVAHNEGRLAGRGQPGVFAERHAALIRERIGELRSSCDWVVLNYHGGEEYTCIPSPLRRTRLLNYLDAGVDIVVAHHAHVVQCHEQRGKQRIFYSLGNFVFDIPGHAGCRGADESALISLLFDKEGYDITTLGTRCLRGKGGIESASAGPSFAPIMPDEYPRAWQSEAWRVTAEQFSSGSGAPLSAGIPAPWRKAAITIRRTLGILRRLKQPYARCMLAGACRHQLARWRGRTV